MGNLGPGEKPKVVRKRAARNRKPAPPAAAIPGLGAVARPDRPARVPPKPTARARRAQRQTEHAQPLSPTPVKPTNVDAPKPKLVARPLQAEPPKGIKAGKPVDDAKQRRGLAVAAYDQLSKGAKRDHVKAAQKRVTQGKATETDVAVLHAHSTRVQGTKKVAKATKAFNDIAGGATPHDTAELIEAAKAPKVKPLTKRDPDTPLETAGFSDISSLKKIPANITAVGKAASLGWKYARAPKIVQNAPKDIADLAVTTPSSLAKVATTAATHPKKLPKMLADPYIELAKHPVKFATERPVSTLLMVTPAGRIPGRAAGRVARLTGKQTLERTAATLPGTALKQTRTGSRGLVTRAVQARKDAKTEAPTMTAAHVQRRVDEFYDFEKHHVARATASAARKAQAKTEGQPRAEARVQVQEAMEGAKAGAKSHEAKRKFAKEFGAPHVRDTEGRVVQPENAPHGALHDSKDAAQAVADHLNAKGIKLERGAHGPHQAARRKTKVDLEFAVKDAGYGQHAVVPKLAAERLDTHRSIGKSKALGAREMRVAGRSFRNAVLPLSARWLVGQAGEAGFRAAVARAGPADVLRFNHIVKRMNTAKKGSGDEFLMRVTGGQFDMTGTAREFAHGKSLAEEFKGSALEDPAHFATKAATTRPAMAVRKGWQAYTNVVFNTVNGWFEQNARKAMAGQAIRQGPFMEKRLLGMTDKALGEAAKGLKGTEAQVQVARDVDRMYGQYQKFSPDKRERLLHTTPFYPWYRNMVTFLTQTLPVDHPLQAALVADLDAATEEWRKAHGLSFHEKDRKPSFLQGGYPTKSGGVKRVGRYLPFMPADPIESGADLFLPQYGNVKDYLKGVDWKGDKVKGSRIKAAAGSVVQAHVPASGQVTRVVKKVKEGKTLEGAIADEVAPLPTSKGGRPGSTGSTGGGSSSGGAAVKIKPVKVKPVKLKPVKVR